jgi:hypothetical protein
MGIKVKTYIYITNRWLTWEIDVMGIDEQYDDMMGYNWTFHQENMIHEYRNHWMYGIWDYPLVN